MGLIPIHVQLSCHQMKSVLAPFYLSLINLLEISLAYCRIFSGKSLLKVPVYWNPTLLYILVFVGLSMTTEYAILSPSALVNLTPLISGKNSLPSSGTGRSIKVHL